ncbi:hypothetical protein F5Y15DRAFT_54271 [Xylariaceae sp. FL0016]|nr:hypothetical protein F5Y15DRAFT_54271 [Xylariaceae sp. FL0016]
MSSGNSPFPAAANGSLPTDSRGAVVIGVSSMCLVIATTAVGFRLYTRFYLVGKVGIDDWMAMMSIACLVSLVAAQCINVQSGLGTHIYMLDLPSALVGFLRDFWYALLFYNIALFFVKMTFLFQYYRIVAQVQKLRLAYIGAMVVIGGWTISQIMLICLLCRPINKLWDTNVEGKCVDANAEQDLNAVGNIITDFIVLVLPLPVLLRLNLQKNQKWALVGVFSLGFLTCIISIMRRVVGLRLTKDLTYSSVDVTVWSISEVTSGITCAALPTLKPLASKYIPALKSQIQRYTDYGKGALSRRGTTTTSTQVSSGKASGPYSTIRSHKSQQLSISKPSSVHASVWADDQGGNESHEMDAREPSHQRTASAASVRRSNGPLTSNRPEPLEVPDSAHGRNVSQDSTLTKWPSPVSTTITGGADAVSRPGSAVNGGVRVKHDVRIESSIESPRDPPPMPPPRDFV